MWRIVGAFDPNGIRYISEGQDAPPRMRWCVAVLENRAIACGVLKGHLKPPNSPPASSTILKLSFQDNSRGHIQFQDSVVCPRSAAIRLVLR